VKKKRKEGGGNRKKEATKSRSRDFTVRLRRNLGVKYLQANKRRDSEELFEKEEGGKGALRLGPRTFGGPTYLRYNLRG